METMTLQTLIAERDRVAAELREANQRICDEFNRLYPVGTKMWHRSKGDVKISSAQVHYDGKVIVWYKDALNNNCGADMKSLEPIEAP